MRCVYRAKPIDLVAPEQDDDTIALLEKMCRLDYTLRGLDVIVYYPERAWEVYAYTGPATSQILAVNMQAVNVADMVVVYNPGFPTIGVGREIQQAVALRTPVLMFSAPTERLSWSSADIDVIDLSQPIGTLEGILTNWVLDVCNRLPQ